MYVSVLLERGLREYVRALAWAHRAAFPLALSRGTSILESSAVALELPRCTCNRTIGEHACSVYYSEQTRGPVLRDTRGGEAETQKWELQPILEIAISKRPIARPAIPAIVGWVISVKQILASSYRYTFGDSYMAYIA